MSQKSSVPQAASFVSGVLKRDSDSYLRGLFTAGALAVIRYA